MPKLLDLTGMTFNGVKVIARVRRGPKRVEWECLCHCGASFVCRGYSITSGHTVSCGCIGQKRLDEGRIKHGLYRTKEYGSWASMKDRCFKPLKKSYPQYGGRGIDVCPRWLESFENFLSDMGPCPSGHSIDRIDNELGYWPSNCRWATSGQQSRNKRSNVRIRWKGKERVLTDWAHELGFNVATLYARVVRYGWSIDEAFTRPAIYRQRATV